MRNFLYRLKKKFVKEKLDYNFNPKLSDDVDADILYDEKLNPKEVMLKSYIAEAFANGLQDGNYKSLPEEAQLSLIGGLNVLERLVRIIERNQELYANTSKAYSYGKKIAELAVSENLSKEIPYCLIDKAYQAVINSVL